MLLEADAEEAAPLILPVAASRRQKRPGAIADMADIQANRRRSRRLLRMGLIVSDVALIIVGYGVAGYLYIADAALTQLVPLLSVILPIYLGIALNGHAYSTEALHHTRRSVRRSLAALLFSAGAVALVAFFLKATADFSRVSFGAGTVLCFVLLAAGRWAIARWARAMLGSTAFAELVILDGVSLQLDDPIPCLNAADHGLTPDPGDPLAVQRLGNFVRNADRVIIACPPERRTQWAFLLKALDIHADVYAPELDQLGAVATNQIGSHSTLTVSTGPLALRHRVAKRAFDLIVLLPFIPFLALPMLIVAVAIKLESPGPVLFRQPRIGLGNRAFNILKFRSMRVDHCDRDGQRSTARDDDRITRVGRFIRATSIDELPQIFNVLTGDMSIVGPRPHAAGSRADNMLFWDIDHRYWHRHAVKPGLTGLAQIRGYRGATEAREDLSNRLQADLEYRANWSLLRDVGIILSTFKVLIHRNAY